MALIWEGGAWPPEADAARLEDYRRYQLLFEGDHATAFEQMSAYLPPGRRRRLTYLVLNYAGLITKLAADLLFSEAPVFNAPAGEGLQSLKEIIGTEAAADEDGEEEPGNSLNTTLYESALSASFRGDAVFRVRWGKRHPDDTEETVIIEEVPASSYFVELSPDNVRQVLSECVAWVHRVPNSKTCYLRVEEHTPGFIRNKAFRLHEATGKVGSEVPLEVVYGSDVAVPPVEERTGVNRSLLVHVPNFRHGSRYFGMSDFYDLEPLFDALNNRVSKSDRVLDRHCNPKLVLPSGSTDQQGVVQLSDVDTYEVDSAQMAAAVKYVTWDAKLEAAFRHAEMLIDQIFRLAEVSPAAFGLDKAGNIESGRAMKMRFIRTAAKIARKRQYFDVAIRRVLWLAQKLKQLRAAGPKPVKVEIHWMDGIPEDYKEAVENEARRIEAGLTSKESALKRIDNVDDDQAREEIERMRQEAPTPTAPATLPAGDKGRETPAPEAEKPPAAPAAA